MRIDGREYQRGLDSVQELSAIDELAAYRSRRP